MWYVQNNFKLNHPEHVFQHACAMYETSAAFRLKKMSDPKQIWVGSIPEYLDEAGAILEMRAYNIRPWKLVLRSRGEGKDCHHLHTTTCVWCLRDCECVRALAGVCGMCVYVYVNVECTA
jgi:hypothetical protein